jgi:SAM-dependent methyltransferase
METPMNDDLKYHETRFAFDDRREVLWRTLCDCYFNRLIAPAFHVLELGAGYGHFINNVKCASKTAVDRWPLMGKYLNSSVNGHVSSATDLGFIADHSVDFVFASNLFEHLTQAELAICLAEVRRTLKQDGTLNILQPNYRRAYKEYFDDYTHVSVYSDISLCDFLTAHNFEIIDCHPGFLPFSIKSDMPVIPALIRLYMASPWKPKAKQMFVRARPAKTTQTKR